MFQAIILCNLKENYWATLEKMVKNVISGPILVCLPQIWVPKFFLMNSTFTSSQDITLCNLKEN